MPSTGPYGRPDKATRQIVQARTDLARIDGFFAALAYQLTLRTDPECETGWTDGTTLAFSPTFVDGLTDDERVGFVAHETGHNMLGHSWRRGTRDPRRWNKAADRADNQMLRDAGLTLPPGALFPEVGQEKWSAEALYGVEPDEPDDGNSDPGGCGETRDAPAPSDGQEDGTLSEADWQCAVMQAEARARKAGHESALAARLVKQIKEPGCRDLVAALLEWASRVSRDDYSMARPNYRYVPHGLYLPSLFSTSLPPIVAAVDTSGSIDAATLETYVGALQRVLDECGPEQLVTIACDTSVTGVQTYEPGERVGGNFPGGGGTAFAPAFTEAEGHQPCGLVYLTDLCGSFPKEAPDFPTLWVCLDRETARIKPPFGDVIWIDG